MTQPTLPNTYIPGQTVFLQDVITDPTTGLGIDDATDAVTVYSLSDQSVTGPITGTHDGVAGSGRYVAQFTPTLSGWHEYVWRSSGSGTGARPGVFWVRPVP